MLARILKVYIAASVGFNGIFSPDVLNNTKPPQGCIFEVAPSMGTIGGIHSKDRGEAKWPDCPGPACRSVGGHIPSMTFSKRVTKSRIFGIQLSY